MLDIEPLARGAALPSAGRAARSPTPTRPRALPCLTTSDDHGDAIDEAEVVFWGLYPDRPPHPAHYQSLTPEGSRCPTAPMQSLER